MLRAAEDIRSGDLRSWAGIGKSPTAACLEEPTIRGWVVAPRVAHLEQCSAYVRSYFRGASARLLHPHPRMQNREGGRKMWLLHEGVSCLITFLPASGWSALTGFNVHALWADEAGLLESNIWDAVAPLLWAQNGRLIATGTPSMGTHHWFSQGCLSGLDPSHEFYQPDIVELDPHTTTIIGSSYEAFSPNVRERAHIDARKKGEGWEKQWVLGDWRPPDVFVYNEWEPGTHVVGYEAHTYRIKLPEGWHQLPRPTSVIGTIDWAYSAQKPGACVIFHVWQQNPLDRQRSGPLVVAVRDAQEAMAYTTDGWYKVFRELKREYKPSVWYADPSMPELIVTANKVGRRPDRDGLPLFGKVKKADKADKAGRINLVKSLLHHVDGEHPAFFVSESCRILPRQFENYEYKLDRDKNPTDEPSQYEDHALDCVAFMAGMVIPRGVSGGARLVAI